MTLVMTPGKALRRLVCAGAGCGRSPFGEEPGDLLGRNLSLAAGRAGRPELAVALPTAERLDPHAEELRRLTDPVAIGHPRSIRSFMPDSAIRKTGSWHRRSYLSLPSESWTPLSPLLLDATTDSLDA